MTRRWAGVYSSSAAGSLGTMLITPPDTLNSTFWPLLRPARLRTLRGTTSSDLVETTTPIIKRSRGQISFTLLRERRPVKLGVQRGFSPARGAGDRAFRR